jgi:hypothetical protein
MQLPRTENCDMRRGRLAAAKFPVGVGGGNPQGRRHSARIVVH